MRGKIEIFLYGSFYLECEFLPSPLLDWQRAECSKTISGSISQNNT
jgi:hypothetical protein